MFTDEEIKFLKKLNWKKTYNLNDNDVFEMEDVVSNFLQINGFDENYKITKDGKLAEDILDKIAEY